MPPSSSSLPRAGGTPVTHGAAASAGAGQPLLYGSSPPSASRWYVPDSAQPRQALAAIQTETEAITQLQLLYGSKAEVRVVMPKFNGGAS